MTFDDFWALYPRRVAKKAARKAWEKLSADQQRQAFEALPDHARMFSNRAMEHVPHAATWLNGERWEDEIHADRGQQKFDPFRHQAERANAVDTAPARAVDGDLWDEISNVVPIRRIGGGVG